MSELDDFMQEVFTKSPQTKQAYEALEPEDMLIRATLNARIQANLTQQELADKAGLHRTDISKIENGKANPSYNTLWKLAKGMGMKVKIEFVPDTEFQH